MERFLALRCLITEQKNASSRAGGFVLIEALIAAAILGVITVAFAQMLQMQGAQIKTLQQKQELLDLKNVVLQAVAADTVCTWQLLGKTMDVSAITTTTSNTAADINLGQLFYGNDPASALIAQAGAPLPQSKTGISVDTVKFNNVIATGLPDQYRGTLAISFMRTNMAVPLRPVEVQRVVTVNPADPVNAKRILQCGAVAPPPVLKQVGCHWVTWGSNGQTGFGAPGISEGYCPVGEYVAGHVGTGITTGAKRNFGKIYCCKPN
jgi:type II secretory pathway pseudopilin PulG